MVSRRVFVGESGRIHLTESLTQNLDGELEREVELLQEFIRNTSEGVENAGFPNSRLEASHGSHQES